MKTRRDFLRMTATSAGAAMVPPAIQRALAIAPRRGTGTIQDVEHVVILMQENRSFDHYFGTLRGVRGFGDPRPAPLPNGQSVWHQPVAAVKTKRYHARGLSPDAKYVLPFYLNPKRTTEFQAGTDHGWSSGHLAWNDGRYDQWVNQKQDVLTMGYLKRQDVSFHYALADAFTLCDAYFCSTHSNTCPNRIYLWSGTIDARNAMGKKPNGPGLEERAKTNGYTWTTYPERLQQAGVSWKVYQGGTGVPGTPTDNYTDNSLEFFAQYQVQEGASPASPLVRQGVSSQTLRDLRSDVEKGTLPQVSWVVAPYKYCEHPEASPTDGAYFISQVMEALTADPDVWSKTAFLINYDENDGLFDHIIPPMPPKTNAAGQSGMVSADLRESLQDEFLDLDKYPHEMHPLVPGADPGGLQPIGLGPRVPMLVLSPWSTGGWVCSQVFDHTSVLQFLENRFHVEEPNISKWRRAVCGDLTAAFDFSNAGPTRNASFPVPAPMKSLHHPYQVPPQQLMPQQEPGTRPARALPYRIETQCHVASGRVTLDLVNRGSVGAAFYVFDAKRAEAEPRRYTVSSGDTLSDFWELSSGFDLLVHGPNGYLVHQKGTLDTVQPEVTLQHEEAGLSLKIAVRNPKTQAITVNLAEAYAGSHQTQVVQAHGNITTEIPLKATDGWFDVSLTLEEDAGFLRRFAGHVEDGKPSTSDPGVGRSS
ncbi:phosphocholine-specific phospholipase C [Terriglobus saanensis]|uniref:phospholipase C n=1 Tax=Terriglobus saanensis (strain ATCC BAA-1853 / DSM 23119 / SP1PR4) TaxID=401053 RepID=E8UZU1_TERSS|nr:phospholipase C, phosphocholine-specific [Terriglobus saanensis]ADV81018.1 phospholipase C, phosphocholine-specific [Terriglobus saanensis SP1PR4]